MSNAKADQRRAAREAAEVAAKAAEKKRKIKVALTYTGIVAVVLALVVIIAFVMKGSQKARPPAAPASIGAHGISAAQQTLVQIPEATYDQIGAGSASKPPATNAAAITEGGKPVVVYVGAEFCPYCAGERWAVIAALSRFGTWSNLAPISSAASDVFPSTSTFSFKGAGYTSKYVVFSGTEVEDGAGKPLDTPNARDKDLWTSIAKGGFPFLDVGGVYAAAGAQFVPTSLHVDPNDAYSAPTSWDEIAAGLKDPSSQVSRQILGAANILTAQICGLTHDQPAAVCSSAGVTAAR